MRFAYIDSQGNEVPIPSVDALALRIELGAIGPDTQLYDAQADRWGPAESHEIFHTLRRQRGRDEGFVAPPPPVAPPPGSGGPATSGPAEAEAGATEPEVPVPEAPLPEPVEAPPEVELRSPTEAIGPAEEPVFDFSGEFDVDQADSARPEVTDSVGDESLFGELELTPEMEPAAPDFGEPAPDVGELAPDAGEDGNVEGFDFGDMGSLELEVSPFDEEEVSLPESDAGTPSPAEGTAGGLGGGMELEQPLSDMGFTAGDLGAEGLGGGMELEAPMSEFSSDTPPAWMQGGQDAAAGGSPSEPAPVVGPLPPATDEGGAARRPPTRSRSAPPRRKKKKPIAPILLGVVGAVAVGGGGWFAWQWMAGREKAPVVTVPELPPVTIPEIPAELLPTMRDIGEQALADMIAELESMRAEFDLPDGVNPAWLGGRYLADASQYPDIQQYWESIESFLKEVRSRDQALFHEKYVARVTAAGIVGDTANILVERADSGFKATQVDREDAYRLMEDLVTAALDLHAFLLQNEQEISYEPAAAGMSRDPVLEAAPSSKSLGNEMWDMVDRITNSLQELGTLDRVTTDRLLAVLFDRIRRAGFR